MAWPIISASLANSPIQLMLHKKSAMLCPSLTQSNVAIVVINSLSALFKPLLNVLPALAHFTLRRKLLSPLPNLVPIDTQSMPVIKLLIVVISPDKPVPNVFPRVTQFILLTKPITPLANANPVPSQSAVVTKPYKALIRAWKYAPIVRPRLSQSTSCTRPFSPSAIACIVLAIVLIPVPNILPIFSQLMVFIKLLNNSQNPVIKAVI